MLALHRQLCVLLILHQLSDLLPSQCAFHIVFLRSQLPLFLPQWDYQHNKPLQFQLHLLSLHQQLSHLLDRHFLLPDLPLFLPHQQPLLRNYLPLPSICPQRGMRILLPLVQDM